MDGINNLTNVMFTTFIFSFIPILIKITYSFQVTDIHGNYVPFANPIFLTFINCFAMCLYFFSPAHEIHMPQLEQINESVADHEEDTTPEQNENSPLLGGQLIFSRFSHRFLRPITSSFGFLTLDLLGRTLKMISLLFLTPSEFQLSRCTYFAWTTFFSDPTALNRRQIYGSSLGFLGFLVLETSTIFGSRFQKCNEQLSLTKTVGLLCNQLGLILEMMTSGRTRIFFPNNSHDMTSTGQGFWEMAILFVLVYPIAYILPGPCRSHLEDPADSFQSFFNSNILVWLIWILVPFFLVKELVENEELSFSPTAKKGFLEWYATLVVWCTEYTMSNTFLTETNLLEVTRSWKLEGMKLLAFIMFTIGNILYYWREICNNSGILNDEDTEIVIVHYDQLALTRIETENEGSLVSPEPDNLEMFLVDAIRITESISTEAGVTTDQREENRFVLVYYHLAPTNTSQENSTTTQFT